MDAMESTPTPIAGAHALPGGPPRGARADLVRSADGDGVGAAFRPALEVAPEMEAHIVRARLISARMIALQRSGRLGAHASSIGAEAAVVGAALAARPTDWIFPGVREWYAALARGAPLGDYVHHALGSAHGPTQGHAPPDLAPARRVRVAPPSGVVGAHLPQAVGAAWAAKTAGTDTASVCLFGAATTESGGFHDAMNFAGVFGAPVVFVCRSRPPQGVAARAIAYGLARARVDGADALAVLTVVRAALARARAGGGATLVEVVLPALPRAESLDGAALGSAEVLELGDADPLSVLRGLLARAGRPSAMDLEARARAVAAELDEAIGAAERAGAPAAATMFDHVYAALPAHLAAQQREVTRGEAWRS